MTDENGAAPPTDEQAVTAPAESEQATPTEASVQEQDAAPENAETEATPEEHDAGKAEEEDRPAKLTRNQRLQRKAARLATMVAEQAAQIEEFKRNSESKADLPKVEDYPQGEFDPGYVSDLAAHKAAQKIIGNLDERDMKAKTEQIKTARMEAFEEFESRAEELKQRIPDYGESLAALEAAIGQFAPHVVEELLDSEIGPLLAYQLSKNVKLAASLNSMSARDAAREIGRLEAKASLPKPKTTTQAPEPLKQPKGGASAPKDPEKMSMDEYMAWRKGQSAA